MTSAKDSSPPPLPDGADAARYIAALVEELARLARTHKLNALAHILDMARLEAEEIAGSGERSPQETEG